MSVPYASKKRDRFGDFECKKRTAIWCMPIRHMKMMATKPVPTSSVITSTHSSKGWFTVDVAADGDVADNDTPVAVYVVV
jgi:hypothetical protein